MRMIAKLLILVIVAAIAFSGIYWLMNNNPSRQEVIHAGDLVISDGTYLIDNSKFILTGNLIVNGTGKLLVENSEMVFRQSYNQQYTFRTQDNAVVEMHNVKLNAEGKWFNLNYYDNSIVTLDKVEGVGCCSPWHSSMGNVRFTINDSVIGLTINNNVSVVAEGSSLFLELVLTNVSGEFMLPKGYAESFRLDVPNAGNSLMVLDVKKSTFTDWGATLDMYSDVTFVDSSMTIGMNAGSDWTNPNSVVKISNLRTKTYENYSLAYDTNNLTLVNTFVRDWYPQAWNNATVEISDSDLADVQFSGATATVIVRNSNAAIAIARDHVTYMFYNSTIKQDAIANENSRIYLYNTKVNGAMLENDDGEIFIDGKRLG
ncbi:hypothetical protein EPN87_02950 [archaeon]|nr:MAG: hypothetical protein EPN87_02950 [archaeon]